MGIAQEREEKEMVKKIVIAVLVVCGLWAVGNFEHHYTRKDCRVIEVTENWVKFEDYGKKVWAIENDGEFKIGDRADLKMYDNLTSPYIYDDEIVKVVKKREGRNPLSLSVCRFRFSGGLSKTATVEPAGLRNIIPYLLHKVNRQIAQNFDPFWYPDLCNFF